MNKRETKILAVIPTILPTERLLNTCYNLVNSSLWFDCDVQVIYNTETSYEHNEPAIWSQEMEDRLNDLANVFYAHINLNWLHSCNLGLFSSCYPAGEYSHVLLLNDDVELCEGFLEKLVLDADGNSRRPVKPPDKVDPAVPSITAPLYNGFWGQKQREVPWQNTEDRPLIPVNYVDGTCMLISTELIGKIGVLDGSFGAPGWGADVDYCFRARQAGAAIAVCPNAYLWHDKQIGGYSAEKIYGSSGEWHVRGVCQAKYDLEAKYGPEFRDMLGLPQEAYKETREGIRDVESMRRSSN